MPKKVKEEAEWVDDEVTPTAGEITLMFSKKLASRLGSVTASVNVNLAVVWIRCQSEQTQLKLNNLTLIYLLPTAYILS